MPCEEWWQAIVTPQLASEEGGFSQPRSRDPGARRRVDRALEGTGVPVTDVYRRRGEYEALHQLAESLTDYDERLRLWRSRLVELFEAERSGGSGGEGGSGGRGIGHGDS